MGIIRTRHDKNNPYFMLNRSASEDKRLSFKAVGIHTYLMSKPDNWTVRETDLAARHQEGATACRSGLKELREAGYIESVTNRDEKGRIESRETIIHETPQRGLPTPRIIGDIVSNDLLVSNDLEIIHSDEGMMERTAIFDVLEKQWLTVNPAQLEQHLSLSKKYGFENWLRGWTATQPKHRANATYVEKVVISNMPDDEAATAFGFIKTNRARNPIQQADGSVTVEYENKTLIVPKDWVHHLGTEKEEQILSALLTRRAINNER